MHYTLMYVYLCMQYVSFLPSIHSDSMFMLIHQFVLCKTLYLGSEKIDNSLREIYRSG